MGSLSLSFRDQKGKLPLSINLLFRDQKGNIASLDKISLRYVDIVSINYALFRVSRYVDIVSINYALFKVPRYVDVVSYDYALFRDADMFSMRLDIPIR